MTRRLLLVLSASTAALLGPALARAQSSREFSTLRFYPAAGQNNFIGLEGARVGQDRSGTFGGYFDFSAKTLQEDHPCKGLEAAQYCASGKKNFLPHTGMLHLAGNLSIAEGIDVSVDLPLGFTDGNALFYDVATQPDRSSSRQLSTHDGFAIGDARVRGKAALWTSRDESLRLSVAAFTSLPTALITSHGDCRDPKQCSFVGERGLNVGAFGIAEAQRRDFRFALNVGAAYRPSRRLLQNEIGSELLYGAAAEYTATPVLRALAEVAGSANIVGGNDFPVEARGALSLGEELRFTAGGGAGLYGHFGSPSYRIFAGARYTPTVHDLDQDGIPDAADVCPVAAEDKDGYLDADGCPEFDNDEDGVADAIDQCKGDPEDRDGFEDEDGCPELDNDGDGVQDGYDSCEGQKEDIDGDRDDDGCPDFDTDHDGLTDDVDKCVDVAEDRDGLADDDGCPELDFDSDGFPDTDDACPDRMESWNGILDQDGCPEDDADGDSVPDEVDTCPDQLETIDGKADQDGCPDGNAVLRFEGGALHVEGALEFQGTKLKNEKLVLTTLASFVQRAHKRGGLHILLSTEVAESEAQARLTKLVTAIAARTGRKITSSLAKGSPDTLAIELRP
jgi:hypothetical protein